MTQKTFTFTYDFKDFDTPQLAGHVIMGYMIGTYEQPVIEVVYCKSGQGGNANQLCVTYAGDKKLSHIFKRICDSFNDYYSAQYEDMDNE